jgi:hypothetical protein
MNIIASPEYRENLLTLLMETDLVNLGNGTRWIKHFPPPDDHYHDVPDGLRVIIPMHLYDDPTVRPAIRELAIEAVETMFSESTNDDVCRITCTETSAHFDQHFPNTEYADMPFASVVILDVSMEDYLT